MQATAPTLKTASKPYFLFLLTLNLEMAQIGNTMSPTSETRLKTTGSATLTTFVALH